VRFKMAHTNINVLNLEKSIAFYQKALGLQIARTYDSPDGEFKLVYLTDAAPSYQIELTWLKERTEPYNHGDNELHIAFVVDDFQAAYALHQKMGCICYENHEMGIYFIQDPDGYWLEVVPEKK
jgi:lactoylglutathione lyase